MRQVWSESNKRRTWRKIWVALAEVESHFGLVTAEQVEDLKDHIDEIDLTRSAEIEAEIHHDLMAELKTFAGQCVVGGSILHLGATSMDIEDNADALRLGTSLDLILEKLSQVLLDLARLIEVQADTPMIAFTHLQPAEPSTLGYRFAGYTQDLLADHQALKRIRQDELRGKGFKGAVGSRASYGELVGIEKLDDFEEQLSATLGLDFFPITTQTYPRRQEYVIFSALAGVGGCLHKMALDIRFLQSPPIGEIAEPFSQKQVGSSAMPFKRNPINSEKIDSLGRYLAQFPRLAWDNYANSMLERTLDDSANRRSLLPEAFLALEEMLITAHSIFGRLNINGHAIQRNLATFGPFAGTERVLIAAVKSGADRQLMHEILREHAMRAWQEVQTGKNNPLADLLCQDKEVRKYLDVPEIKTLLEASRHVGDCPARALAVAQSIRDLDLQGDT